MKTTITTPEEYKKSKELLESILKNSTVPDDKKTDYAWIYMNIKEKNTPQLKEALSLAFYLAVYEGKGNHFCPF